MQPFELKRKPEASTIAKRIAWQAHTTINNIHRKFAKAFIFRHHHQQQQQ